MAGNKYSKVAKIAIDLFERSGVTQIEFKDPPIKITRDIYFSQILGTQPPFQNPNIQIINNISQHVTVENKTIVKNVLNQLKAEGRDENEIREIRKKLNELSDELQKKKPKWDKIKKILMWALDLGKDIFIQLLPLLIKSTSSV